jgi:L-lactate dehydrogenase complex protein LldG
VNSREKILAAVKKNQPALEALPLLEAIDAIRFDNPQQQFSTVLANIGGLVLPVQSLQQVADYVTNNFKDGSRYITTVEGLPGIPLLHVAEDAHQLEDVEVAIIRGDFGVAENSAIWVTGSSFKIRALPFICQHLVVVLNPGDMVHNMHEAYERIAGHHYDFGVFIAGPSKTADIEQSLVLGAHGPKSMTVFYLS